MLSLRNIVVHFVFLGCIGPNYGAGRLPRDIAPPADSIIHVVNEIFSSLRIKLNGNNNNKELSMIHKYFVGFSQYKNDNWKAILNLTSFDIKIDNGSTDYTMVINEILNGENKLGRGLDKRNDDGVKNKSRNSLPKPKEAYLRNNSYRSGDDKLLPNKSVNHSTNNNSMDEGLNLDNDPDELDVWVPSGSRRVFQGERTKIYHFPFLASIHIFRQFACVGSIIAADLIITAASCLQLAHNNRFYRENPSFLAVRVGSSRYSGAGDLIPALEVYFHQSYDPATLRNNLAIMRLARHIRFRDRARVKRIDIDTNPHSLPVNTNGVAIVGWGAKTVSNKVESPVLNHLAMAVLEFYPLQDCQEIYSKSFVTERNFCAGFVSRGGGACNRDVGAPGLAGGMLVGVVSFGSASCGATDSPTVFTKIGFYTDWIERVMAKKGPSASRRLTPPIPLTPHTIMTTVPQRDLNFLIQPVDFKRPPLSLFDLDTRMGGSKEPKEFVKDTESANHEEININEELTGDEDMELAEDINNMNTQEQKYNNGDQTKSVETKTEMAEQLWEPVEFITRPSLPTNEENTEAVSEKVLDKAQFVRLEANDSDAVDILLNEVVTELSKQGTEADKLPQIDEIKITTNKVVAEQHQIDVNYIDLTTVKNYTQSETTFHPEKLLLLDTRENSFVTDKKSLNEVGKGFAMNYSVAEKSPEPVHEKISANKFIALQMYPIPMPQKQSSEGEILENKPQEPDPPIIRGVDLVTEQPEETFTDPELDQQISELIDYMNIVNIISSEDEYISKGESTRISPEELGEENL